MYYLHKYEHSLVQTKDNQSPFFNNKKRCISFILNELIMSN